MATKDSTKCENRIHWRVIHNGEHYLCNDHYQDYRNYIMVSEEVPVIIAYKSFAKKECGWGEEVNSYSSLQYWKSELIYGLILFIIAAAIIISLLKYK